VTRSGPASADTGNRAQDAAPTAKRSPNVKAQDSAETGREARQPERGARVRQVSDRDGPPLDRLRTAARRGRELIAAGGQRVALSASLTAAAEAAGVACRDAAYTITAALWGAP
jgi:ATP-dependent exoDNAse (exonuclease V) alpha subunit